MMCTACYIVAGFMLLVIILAWLLAKKSNILRDDVDVNSQDFKTAVDNSRYKGITDYSKIPHPYSLSRTQICVWTIIVAGCYLFLYFCNGQENPVLTINSTALWLMGISAGTAAVGGSIDATQSGLTQKRHQNEPSSGFWIDIISDDNGISIHRFQNVLWTIIVMGIYIFQVATKKVLPDLDPTLIGLTGISSATYIGMKIQENK